MPKGRDSRDYALYYGDRFVDVGTLTEIATRQKLSITTIYGYKYKTRKRITKGLNVALVLLDDKDD